MTAGRIALFLGCLLPVVTPAADLPTAQRLELLERRVNLITDLTLQLEAVRRENRELRGEIENLGYQIEQLERKQRDIYLDIDQRLSATQGGGAPPVLEQPPSGEGGARAETAPKVEDRTPAPVSKADRKQIEAEYQAAYALLSPQQRRYQDAAKAFAAFLTKYPFDELTPNAQYWLGEAHYVSQHNAEALKAFEVVVSQYPESTKAPGALFKIGRLQQAAGKVSAARGAYERVLKDYPDSPAAGLARQRLDQLGR
jgi:tol-pal system protein YbgF